MQNDIKEALAHEIKILKVIEKRCKREADLSHASPIIKRIKTRIACLKACLWNYNMDEPEQAQGTDCIYFLVNTLNSCLETGVEKADKVMCYSLLQLVRDKLQAFQQSHVVIDVDKLPDGVSDVLKISDYIYCLARKYDGYSVEGLTELNEKFENAKEK